MWSKPEETWTFNAIFPLSATIVRLQHPSVQPRRRNSLTNTGRGTSTRPPSPKTTKQHRHEDRRVCVCVRTDWLCPAHMFYVCVMIEDREGVYACSCAPHTSLKTNSDWRDGIVHHVQQTCDQQSPAKGNEKAIQALTKVLLAQPLTGIIVSEANKSQRSVL